MSKETLKEYLNYHDSYTSGKDYINPQMPNEIFNDLKSQEFQTPTHRCFAYSYYYLIDYMYRNTVYGRSPITYSMQSVTNIFLKNHRKVYYITKQREGVLDRMGYTYTTNDYPISFYIDNNILSFRTIKQTGQKQTHSPNLMIKLPIKSFHRFDDDTLNGTYYDHQNTHRLSITKFIDIISNDKLGHVAFYLYGYISMMNARFPDGYQASYKHFANNIGCSEKTIARYMSELESQDFITSYRKLVGYKLLDKIYKVK